MSEQAKCPFGYDAAVVPMNQSVGSGRGNRDWWPGQLDLRLLHQHGVETSPYEADFDYAQGFQSLDLNAVKADIIELMTQSQDWWPADYGHYGPLFIRMAWHSAGTYRSGDGRGGAASGAQRFAPLNSWPDNGNLDKARLLLWPVKQKYGQALSWADLMILAGNCALESMGFRTLGFAGGRADVWAPEEDIYWGAESQWLGAERHGDARELQAPLAAVQMGLIYVNPEGPDGVPDPVASAHDIRETFGRMSMNDEETVALIAGGHTFGKAHGAGDAALVGPEPEAAPIEAQSMGWLSRHGSGKAGDTITSGIEGAWTATPTRWDNSYFDTLFGYEWELTHSPAGAVQWRPVNGAAADTVPDAHGDVRHAPMMTTADLALRSDPAYEQIARRFHRHPEEFATAFAHAWFKLTHRDMGPKARYLGPDIPADTFVWQDPIPTSQTRLEQSDTEVLKGLLEASDLTVGELVSTAWASASTYRGSDMRGGANGVRLRLAPQKDWAVNEPDKLARVLARLEAIQVEFNRAGDSHISMADLVVFAGGVAIERAAEQGGHALEVVFTPGRGDALAEQTDVASVDLLQCVADGFRNYAAADIDVRAEELLLDKAQLLTLSAPEMTALLGGLRVLGVVHDDSSLGVLTQRVGVLSNDFFVNLLEINNVWEPVDGAEQVFIARDRKRGNEIWQASRVDLVFGSHSQLRALAEVYASDAKRFVQDFGKAWTKVMNLDRFDLR
ncbi:MAG: catalase/peroxidase HPI [Pseudomonadota bacterium]